MNDLFQKMNDDFMRLELFLLMFFDLNSYLSLSKLKKPLSSPFTFVYYMGSLVLFP